MALGGIQGVSARGVRKINEQTVQEGRALIITEEDESLYSWEDIPNGSLKVNSRTGLIMIKLAGQSNWVPSNIRLDIKRDSEGNVLDADGNKVTDPLYLKIVEDITSQGGQTLSIAKDAIIMKENFTIKNANIEGKQFSYEDETGNRYFGKRSSQGFWFELKKGHYPPGRNMLEVVIDDCLYRSAASGGIVEISETSFVMTEELVDGMELTVTYYQINRIGNPYPRIYLRKGNYSTAVDSYESLTGEDDVYQPENAEIGDIWIDFNGSPEDEDGFLADEASNSNAKIPLSRIDGLPETVADAAAKGIITDAAVKGHRHDISEISGIDLMISTACDNVSSAINSEHANSSDIALTANNSQLLQGRTVGVNPGNIVVVQADGHIDDTLISNRVSKIAGMSDYEELLETVNSMIQNTFKKGMIMAWYGEANKVPEGWVICNGERNTPDLRDKFIMGVGSYELYANIPAGLPNIKGQFGGNSRPCSPSGAFFHVAYGAQGSNTAADGQTINFDASLSNNIYGKSNTVQPPAIAMYYIMKI